MGDCWTAATCECHEEAEAHATYLDLKICF